jgi:hypothetical protein
MSRINKIPCLIVVLCGVVTPLQAQQNSKQILTLFTTQQEREIIDRNRYRNEPEREAEKVAQEPREELKVIPRQTASLKLMLSGVTITQSGENIAWLNGKAYESGATLTDGTKVIISRKSKNLVQVVTPDGQYHALTTGETKELSYLVPEKG